MGNEEEWARLVKLAQNGDQKAYHQFLTAVYPYVQTVIRNKLFYMADIEDIAQECLIGFHRSLSTYHPNRKLKPWLFAIIRHKIADYVRKNIKIRKNEILDEEAMVTNAPQSTNNDSEDEQNLADQVSTMLAALPETLRRSIVLTKVDGLSYREAAEAEGITEATLRKRVSRAYQHILKIVNENSD